MLYGLWFITVAPLPLSLSSSTPHGTAMNRSNRHFVNVATSAKVHVCGAAAERRDYLSPTNLANTLLLYSMFCTTFLKTLDTAPVAGAGFFAHDLFLVTDFSFFNVDKSLHDSFSYVLHRRETFNIRFADNGIRTHMISSYRDHNLANRHK